MDLVAASAGSAARPGRQCTASRTPSSVRSIASQRRVEGGRVEVVEDLRARRSGRRRRRGTPPAPRAARRRRPGSVAGAARGRAPRSATSIASRSSTRVASRCGEHADRAADLQPVGERGPPAPRSSRRTSPARTRSSRTPRGPGRRRRSRRRRRRVERGGLTASAVPARAARRTGRAGAGARTARSRGGRGPAACRPRTGASRSRARPRRGSCGRRRRSPRADAAIEVGAGSLGVRRVLEPAVDRLPGRSRSVPRRAPAGRRSRGFAPRSASAASTAASRMPAQARRRADRVAANTARGRAGLERREHGRAVEAHPVALRRAHAAARGTRRWSISTSSWRST